MSSFVVRKSTRFHLGLDRMTRPEDRVSPALRAGPWKRCRASGRALNVMVLRSDTAFRNSAGSTGSARGALSVQPKDAAARPRASRTGPSCAEPRVSESFWCGSGHEGRSSSQKLVHSGHVETDRRHSSADRSLSSPDIRSGKRGQLSTGPTDFFPGGCRILLIRRRAAGRADPQDGFPGFNMPSSGSRRITGCRTRGGSSRWSPTTSP